MQSKQNKDISLPEGVSWDEIVKLIKGAQYEHILKKIKPSTLKFVLDKKNADKVIKSLLKVLQNTDPENATPDYAQKLMEIMRKVADKVLKNDHSRQSYL